MTEQPETQPQLTEQPDELESMIEAKRKGTPETTTPPQNASDSPANDAITVPVATLNYVVIAVVFLAVGLVLGSFVFPQRNDLPENFEVAVVEAVNSALETAGLVEEPGLVQGENYELTLDVSEDPYLGNPDAPVTIIEFSDFTCGFCGRFAENTLQPLLEEYPDEIRIVYVDYPFLSQLSYPTALAAECAHDQGKFWEMHDILFANQQNLSIGRLSTFAEELELDMDAYNTCFEEGAHEEEIRADLAAAQDLGVRGTPAFFVNGTFVSGAQDITVFRRIIDAELEATG